MERVDPERFARRRRQGPVVPAKLAEACHEVIEAALSEIDDAGLRTRLYLRLTQVADRACRDLTKTPGQLVPKPLIVTSPLMADEQLRQDLHSDRAEAHRAAPAIEANSAADPTPATTDARPAAAGQEAPTSGQNADTSSVHLLRMFTEKLQENMNRKRAEQQQAAAEASAEKTRSSEEASK